MIIITGTQRGKTLDDLYLVKMESTIIVKGKNVVKEKSGRGDLDEVLLTPTFSMGQEEGEKCGFGPLFSSGEEESGVKTVPVTKVKRPSLYKVLLHNDDYTTMEFVVWVLKKFFGKSQMEADEIMLKVHNEGVGVCGVYTYEVAETKVEQVSKAARDEGHPLLCTLEKE